MFFVLSKLFGFLLQPIGIILLLTVYIYLIRKNHTKVKMTALVILSLTYLLSTSFVLKLLVKQWEYPFQSIKEAANKDFAVVLTGGIMDEDFSENGHLQIGHTGDRLWQALHLYQVGKISKILISGGDIHLIRKGATSEAAAAVKFLLQNGVDSTAIYKEVDSRNTYENAKFTKRFLEKNKWGINGYLITSSFHMKRAKACFELQGLSLSPFPSGHIFKDKNWTVYDFVPRAYFLAQSEAFFKEITGFYVYKSKGYL